MASNEALAVAKKQGKLGYRIKQNKACYIMMAPYFILFFTFTGTKGQKKTKKDQTVKQPKAKKVKTEKVEAKGEVKEEVEVTEDAEVATETDDQITMDEITEENANEDKTEDAE